MSGPPIDRDAVARLAELAQLELPATDLARVSDKLAAIVAYAEELATVDVEGIAPMDRPFSDEADEASALREDVPGEELPHELALGAGPRTSEGGFDVPGFVDEG